MSREVYVQLELHGPGDQAIGFLEGFRLGSGETGSLWVAGLDPIDLGGFVETMRERMHLDTHVVLARELAERVVAALGEARRLHLKVASSREIDRAELCFDFRCFSREDGLAVRRVIESDLPDGVRLEGYEPKEEIVEDARGVELYSPVHDYVLSGNGCYVGPVAGVFALAARLDQQDFLHPHKVRLHHAS